ncbi:hypothetical protein Dsin_013416 [Dipteronia sinensis]|uniref:Uncharacterized protein n=1 Tax=Dipteronia sinensis TaxID=43782 RepID=A0AAE0AJW8_9ROSI|nr:hypothetical protein Dsin_013416 [Dipteronia sinensis]
MVECRRCVELEAEIAKKKSDHEALEARFRALEVEKVAIEDELKTFKREKEEGIVDLTTEDADKEEEEEETVAQLMIENSVLECEKRKAENEVEFLKRKLKDFESKFEETPDYHTPSKHISCSKGENEDCNGELKIDHGRRVRKHLTFEEDKSPSKKMAPSTPCAASTSSLGVIDICDSDDENVQLPSVDNQGSVDNKDSSNSVLFQHSCEENMNDCNGEIPVIPTPKRKRASNIVTSDSENDEDDNVPICKLKRLHLQERISGQARPELKICSETGTPPGDDDIANLVTPPRRRLVSLRKREVQKRAGKGSSSKATTENVEDDESEEAGSESEGESLNGFIVDSTDVEDDDESSDAQDESSDAQDESDDNENFGEILSRIKRSRGQKLSWEFEADMLAAFGKDPKLCMKAVCALYRQQTSEEKVSKGSLVNNCRGFNKFDAHRGSDLAQFLTNGDSECDLKKSVKELLERDPKGVEKCRTLATRYSKQLFEIYQNKEDPLFLPS